MAINCREHEDDIQLSLRRNESPDRNQHMTGNNINQIPASGVAQPKRRNLLISSAAALFSAALTTAAGVVNPSLANAASFSTLEESENRRIEVFERNAPSVVFIDTFAERQDVFSPNVLEVPLGTGSGFVWDKEGHIVTNYHVVRNAKFAQVALITPRKGEKAPMGLLPSQQVPSTEIVDDHSSLDIFTASPSSVRSTTNKVSSDEYKRTVFKATVVGSDPGKDIAVLKIEAPPELLYPIQVGKSAGLKVGQLSLAIGNPFGLDHTLTVGVISGLGREVKSPIGRPITNVIQVSSPKIRLFQFCNDANSNCRNGLSLCFLSDTFLAMTNRRMRRSIPETQEAFFWIPVEN
jgi:S1-C subfamily serine protease